ncbi:hypothetical protein [Amycolatopsis sp. YIM 10]|nr:hypothetical protein [Amycolatopsis sp. YIM 10]
MTFIWLIVCLAIQLLSAIGTGSRTATNPGGALADADSGIPR